MFLYEYIIIVFRLNILKLKVIDYEDKTFNNCQLIAGNNNNGCCQRIGKRDSR